MQNHLEDFQLEEILNLPKDIVMKAFNVHIPNSAKIYFFDVNKAMKTFKEISLKNYAG